MKSVLKRFGAYLIDILIVSIIAAVLSNISIINSQLDSYLDVYDNYIKVQDDYKNEKINDKEYDEKIENLSYKLNKCSVTASIISIACLIAYFGIFQYSQNGRTVGKRLFKLKVVKKDGEDINLFRSLLRSLVLNNILFMIANVICISCLNKTAYLTSSKYVSNIELIVQISILITIVMSNENRGLHDFIAGTKVIDLKNPVLDLDKEKEKEKIIEGEIIEKIKEPKNS